MPDFFIVGAPKCGTTALAYYLDQHPDVDFSSPKEPGFFSRDVTQDACKFRTLDHYLERCFSSSGGMKGEGSTTMFYSENAVAEVLSGNARAKFIVMLRHPVDLVCSHHLQQLKMGYEVEPDFERAWRLQYVRSRDGSFPPSCEIKFNLIYEEIGRIKKYFDKLVEVTPPNQLLILDMQEFSKNTRGVFSKVLEFLDLEQCDVDLSRMNHKSKPRFRRGAVWLRQAARCRDALGIPGLFGVGNRLRALNNKPVFSFNIRDEFYEELTAFYREDIDFYENLFEGGDM